jgi:hypothetical protein
MFFLLPSFFVDLCAKSLKLSMFPLVLMLVEDMIEYWTVSILK